MKNLLAIAALGEAGTGFVLLVYPSIVVRLLFAAEIVGAGVVMSLSLFVAPFKNLCSSKCQSAPFDLQI
jgi:hypothetical protein